MLAAVLTIQRFAEASCTSPTCSIVVVDASCQAVPSGQPVSGDPLRVEIKCTTMCCAGATTCGQSPYDASAELLGLKKYEMSQGVETLSAESVTTFSADASCPDVYVSQACVPSGKYAVEVMSGMAAGDVEVTQGDCSASSGDGGCSVAVRPRDDGSPLWLLTLLGGASALCRRRGS